MQIVLIVEVVRWYNGISFTVSGLDLDEDFSANRNFFSTLVNQELRVRDLAWFSSYFKPTLHEPVVNTSA